jgi:serine/threonine protein kinase
MNIVHGDIKLENYVISNRCEESLNCRPHIKLIDFGCAQQLETSGDLVACNQGTPLYMAPETLESKLNLKSDVWAVGVMLYFMLMREFPFDDHEYNSRYGIWREIVNKEINYNHFKLQNYSPRCVHLLRNLLNKDYKQRLDVDQSLSHEWFY